MKQEELLELLDASPENAVIGFFVGRLQALDQHIGMLYAKIRDGKSAKPLPTGSDTKSLQDREKLLAALAAFIIKMNLAEKHVDSRNFITVYSDMYLLRILLHKAVLLNADLSDEDRKKHEDILLNFRKRNELHQSNLTKSEKAENDDSGAIAAEGESDNDGVEGGPTEGEEAPSAETQQLEGELPSTSAADLLADEQLLRESLAGSVDGTGTTKTAKPTAKRGGQRRKQRA